VYNRYAESARVVWAYNIATLLDPMRGDEWKEMWTPKGMGMILRSMKTDFKLVRGLIHNDFSFP